MNVVAALAPIIVALIGLLVARRVWLCAIAGLVIAMTQAVLGAHGMSASAFEDGLALWLEAAVVVFPGLVLNAVLAQRGAQQKIAEWVDRLPLSRCWKYALVILGVGPALECLTGFGVSLLVTIPILIALDDGETAVRRASIGMVIVPWGTVGLATTVGASIARVPVSSLGTWTALIYLAILPVLGGLATGMGKVARRQRARSASAGVALGLLYATALVAANYAGLTPVAGIVSGVVVMAMVLAALSVRESIPRPPLDVLAPYGIAISIVAVMRVLTSQGVPLDAGLPIGHARVVIGTSPGLALLIAALWACRGRIGYPARTAGRSGWRTATALGAFLFMAQAMVEIGSITTIARAVAGGGATVAAFLCPVLALGSGFVTGSGTSGNALMMTAQASIGATAGLGRLASALQNAGAGTHPERPRSEGS